MRIVFNPSPLTVKAYFASSGLGYVQINSATTIMTTTTTYGARPV